MENLLIDFYELTMGQGYFNKKMQNEVAYFDLFFRRVPDKGSFVIANGVKKCLEYLQNFSFSDSDIDYLKSLGRFTEPYMDYLKTVKFTGDMWAVEDGTVVFANEPVITIKAPLLEAQLVETALLLHFNRSSLITTKASRIIRSAEGRGVMEFGTRRAQGTEAAVDGALDAYIAGAIGTACTLTGKKYGVPVIGTMAHSFVQSFETEYEAFRAYAESFPNTCTLLVDTYNTLESGMVNAIKVYNEVLKPMGKTLKGIRIDSGDLAYLSKKARKMLDEAGLSDTKIVASNSLDENIIKSLIQQGAPI
ncbi:MAG: nicotinate phosphoribosyltransferase, partial [Tenericutes bacterium HGW-Tenericutes-4]